MNFRDCIQDGMLTETGDSDPNKAAEMLALAEHKEKFWKEVEDKAEKYPSLFIEGYYEVIKELIIAILALDGWKATNHDCLFQYIIEKKQELDLDTEYLSELRKLRNKIDYHGVKINADIWKGNKMKLIIITRTLHEHICKEMKKKNQ